MVEIESIFPIWRTFVFQKTEVVISQHQFMSTKFGLLIDFDLLKAAISTNAKPEIVLSDRGRHLDKAI